MQFLKLMKNIVPNIDVLRRVKTAPAAWQWACERAKEHTQRTKLLVLDDPVNLRSSDWVKEAVDIEVIPAGSAAQLCKAIASSAERIAAIVVKYHQSSPYYYKKVRELASAEGAVMIWDESDTLLSQFNIHTQIAKNIQPDIFCFSFTRKRTTVWIGGKKHILREKSHECR